jgi:hypothetical protein
MTATPIINDPDMFGAAKLLIDQYGEDAAIRAARLRACR